MRIKLESAPPLSPLKAWYSVHTCTAVSDLKTLLCHELHQLRDADIRETDIVLLLEDFELLDSSPIDVIRDGDLILLKRASAKRKASAEETSISRKRIKHADTGAARPHAPSTKTQINGHVPQQKADADPASSSSDSDSSSSESGSESKSDSSSGSDDSSSDSDSDSSSTPSTQPTRSLAFKSRLASYAADKGNKTAGPSSSKTQPSVKPAPKPFGPPVPPGLGKSTTHNRNIRRRRKKMYERLALTAEPASVNEIPLGTKPRTAEPEAAPDSSAPGEDTSTAAPVFMMSTLQNKNKKKGFKNALASGVPAKILFEGTADPPQTEAQTLQDALPFSQTANHDLAVTYARLIPPSEKQESGQLPPRMFVTSVDVEEGLRQKRKRKKDKAPARAPDEPPEVDLVLPYDDPEEADVVNMDSVDSGNAQSAGALDRQTVEVKWSSFAKITDRSHVHVGDAVGWKALGINPATFTPEMLLSIGRVVTCGEQLTVELDVGNGPIEISFGGVIEAEESETLEDTFEWQDVYQGDWRVVSRG